jgi:hypothetical protein
MANVQRSFSTNDLTCDLCAVSGDREGQYPQNKSGKGFVVWLPKEVTTKETNWENS